ncbi:hypothetical protein ACER0A_000680 [Haloimpatiens sp. FM7315]
MKNKKIIIIVLSIFLLVFTIYVYQKVTNNLSAEQVVKNNKSARGCVYE